MDQHTLKHVRRSLWSTIKRVDAKYVEGHIHEYLSMDPACCIRQHVCANARAWAKSKDGQAVLAGLAADRANKLTSNR